MGPEIGTNWRVKCQVFFLTKVAVRWGVTSDINNFLVELIRMVKHNVSVKRTVYGKKLEYFTLKYLEWGISFTFLNCPKIRKCFKGKTVLTENCYMYRTDFSICS